MAGGNAKGVDGGTERSIDGRIDERFEGGTEGRIDGRIDERFEGGTEGRIDGSIEGGCTEGTAGGVSGCVSGDVPGRKPGSFALGVILLVSFLIMAIFAPAIAPFDPWKRFEPYQPPGPVHLLGTNDMGNDILSELIYGSRVSLLVGFVAALLATFIGTAVGLVSGYLKGTVDEILMGVTDIFLMIPQIPLIIVLAAFLRPSFILMAWLMGLLWWTSTARVVRSRALQLREMGYIQAAQALGFSSSHIILTDMLPNILPVIMPKFMLAIASAMIAEASISFLGLGDTTMKSWGMMINFAFTRGGFINGYWWWYLTPGLCITLFVFSAVLIGFSAEEQENETLRL
ncbi:MAG TPA: ABC transporter permease [Methanothrix sp.]|nr:ABC transporter permease [Methanothrix sp.]